MDDQHKIKWTLYVALTSLFLFITVSEVRHFTSLRTIFISETHLPLQKYVIVFDGGSTGTRIHVFSFATSLSGHLTLKSEYFEEVKPGLSGYVNNPHEAANSVIQLLEKAKTLVPLDKWSETPVALKATAGLRLLPDTVSNSLLEEVYKAFDNSPFHSSDDCVTILSGEDEGLYAWYTLNFLLGRLNDANHSVASLDLGGGSTQITFSPATLDTLIFSPKDYILLPQVQNRTTTIYTHSYLGLGLMSARHSILQFSTDRSVPLENNGTVTFSSSCIHPHDKTVWKHDLKEYIVMGRKSGKYGFKNCYYKAVEFLGNAVHRPEELMKREIYVLSYYFDRAFDLGIIGKEGGIRTVDEFVNSCKHSCSSKQPKEIFLCLDCTYITALMKHGLGLDGKKELRFAKQIDGIETSWGLGAAFNMLR
uniref:nucleoside diphosphate phosphatase n=2 Tax=Parasteatoda tepidariorum TaxID=114398 RepID=A0A2L2YHM8_PARTP